MMINLQKHSGTQRALRIFMDMPIQSQPVYITSQWFSFVDNKNDKYFSHFRNATKHAISDVKCYDNAKLKYQLIITAE